MSEEQPVAAGEVPALQQPAQPEAPTSGIPEGERRARRPLRLAFFGLLALFLVLAVAANSLVARLGELPTGDTQYESRLLTARLAARVAGIQYAFPELSPWGRQFAEQALALYLAALRSHPADPQLRAAAAILYGHLGREFEASALLAKGLGTAPNSRALWLLFRFYAGERPQPGWALDANLRELLTGVTVAPLFWGQLYEKIGMTPLAQREQQRAGQLAVRTLMRLAGGVAIYLLATVAALALAVIGLAGKRWWGRHWLEAPPWGTVSAAEALILWFFMQVMVGVVGGQLLAAAGVPLKLAAEAPALLFTAYVLASLVALAWFLPRAGLWRAAGWRWEGGRQVLRALGGAAVVLPLAGALGVIGQQILRNQPPTSPLITIMAQVTNPWLLAVMVVMAVVLAPVVEETLFRGILYGGLRRRLGMWPAALLSGLIFGVVHYQPVALLALVGLGVAFAVLYERSRSLVVPAIAHGVFNGVNVLLLLALR